MNRIVKIMRRFGWSGMYVIQSMVVHLMILLNLTSAQWVWWSKKSKKEQPNVEVKEDEIIGI